MTRGKYAGRADGRLKVLESEAIQSASAKIKDLEKQLGQAKHELHTANTQMKSQAMQAAAGLSAREKQHLRDQVASLEHKHSKDRMELAILTWEVMHRTAFGRPAPLKMSGTLANRSNDLELKESYEYWTYVNWELGSLFFEEYDDVWKFFKSVEGVEWRVAGFSEEHDGHGRVSIKTTSRQSTRSLRKGRIRQLMLRRFKELRGYHGRILAAREHDSVEPVMDFRELDATIKVTTMENRVSSPDE